MYLTSSPPWFCFIVHPRHLPDLESMQGASLLRRYSSGDEEFVRRATSVPALVLGEVLFGSSSMRGEVLGAVRMPDMMLRPEGEQAVIEAARLAAHRGTSVIGLGALTAPVTGGGARLLAELPSGVTVTNGNGLTAAVARHDVLRVAEALALRSPRVAVLGATGSVGVAASRLLVDEGVEPILLGRSEESLKALLGDLARRAVLTDDASMLQDADIVLVLTNHPSALLQPEVLKPGAVVVDVAQPANIPRERYDEFAGHGVLVVEGGIVRIPGYRCTQEFLLDGPEDTFACLAETYLMVKTGMREHSVGRPTPEFARSMEALALRHDVRPRPISFERRVSAQSIVARSGGMT